MSKTETKKEKPDISKQYYQMPEKDLQEKIVAAKQGDSKAQLELLDVFHPYFNKYLMLLYYGRYDLGFYDIRRFIGLFVPDKGLNYFLLRNKLNKDGFSKVNDVVSGLVSMVKRYGTPEDAMQTIHMTFLDCIDRYNPSYRDPKGRYFEINGKKKKTFQVGVIEASTGELAINPYTEEPFKAEDGILVPFSGFLYNYFFFLLSRHVKFLHLDQLGRKTYSLSTSNDDSSEDGGIVFCEPADNINVEDAISAEHIDENWVLGDTCSDVFGHLSVKERQLLKWKYVDGLKAAEIKNRITEHPNTTRDTINKIREQLQGYLDSIDEGY